jgi:hypothetical protein
VLAAQTHGDNRSETANDEPFGVDDHPLLLHLCRLLGEGCHSDYSLSGPLARRLKGRFLLLELAPFGSQKESGRKGCVLARCIKRIWEQVNMTPSGILKNN